MLEALSQWRRVIRPNGLVLFSSFTDTAFRGLADIFKEDMEAAGVDVAKMPLATTRLTDIDVCSGLMSQAGYVNIKQTTLQMGYHLPDENAWWDTVRGAALRGFLALIPESSRTEFKQKHLARISKMRTDEGIWTDVGVQLTLGQVPAEGSR